MVAPPVLFFSCLRRLQRHVCVVQPVRRPRPALQPRRHRTLRRRAAQRLTFSLQRARFPVAPSHTGRARLVKGTFPPALICSRTTNSPLNPPRLPSVGFRLRSRRRRVVFASFGRVSVCVRSHHKGPGAVFKKSGFLYVAVCLT